jgi:hypothetical protein
MRWLLAVAILGSMPMAQTEPAPRTQTADKAEFNRMPDELRAAIQTGNLTIQWRSIA